MKLTINKLLYFVLLEPDFFELLKLFSDLATIAMNIKLSILKALIK